MTIEPGTSWGCVVDRPDDLVIVDDDAALASALAGGAGVAGPVAVTGGDLARTLGNPPLADRRSVNRLPIDLIELRLDGAEETFMACAHVVARSPARRGGWWRGPVLLVMNAEFLGDWDVAPRGHPNDGRVETFEVDATFSVRDRLAARRRLPTGRHVPHPSISTRSVRAGSWTSATPRAVFADGRQVGVASSIEVAVLADAATIYA